MALTPHLRIAALYLLVPWLALPGPVQAQEAALPKSPLKQLTLEELLDIDVSLPLRREERVFQAPAAVSLLTSEDLRRLGAVTLPEALSTVPGLFVSRFTASSWVVTTRGFASTAANKLLVMIDGRSVYSPLFSGVLWDQQDAFLLDLDRIEVTRGPGASLWGSNAVNGVINVVSKPASQTQGTLVTIGGGAEERFHTGVRYGGRAGGGHYRVYGLTFIRDEARLSTGEPAQDGQRFGQGGFRTDFGDRSRALTLQGDVYVSRADLFGRDDIQASGGNLLARWTRRAGASAELNVQAYFDRTTRRVPQQFAERRNTFDVDIDQRRDFGRHSLNVGGGFRRSDDDTDPTPLLFFEPEERATNLVTVFAQDEFHLTPTLAAIGGLRAERNDYTGWELQPMGRMRWNPSATQTIWGAVSRAVRLPTRFDTDLRIQQNGVVVITGSDDFDAERAVAYEFGYRHAPVPRLVWSLELFHNRYDDLRTQEPAPGAPVRIDNGLNVDVSGLKLAGSAQPRPWARITTSYTYLHEDASLDPDSRDLGRGLLETIDPTHQLQLSARFDLPHRVELDGPARYVSALPTPGTPAYTEAGFRLGWHATSRLELALVGRDLLHRDHIEFVSPTSVRQTRLQRALFTRATLTF
jgi:iron complex outermembrane receptor protein